MLLFPQKTPVDGGTLRSTLGRLFDLIVRDNFLAIAACDVSYEVTK